MKFSQLIKRKTLHGLVGWVLDPSLPIYQFTTINQKTNYDKIIAFYFFESVHRDVKNCKYPKPKINRLHYTVILAKS